MKKLMELDFFDKGIFATIGYWGTIVKRTLSTNTPTLYLAHADTQNKQQRKWHKSSVTNCYCRACDTLMVVPGAIDNLLSRKAIFCPSCGYQHKISNVLVTEDSSSTMPLYIRACLLELKNCIRLKFTYEAIILGESVYNDYSENNKVIEQFDFLYTEKRVIWKKYVNDVEEIREIGFYKDLLKPLQTVLQYLPYSAIDRKGKKISELMMYLRNYLNRKMKEQGYSTRNLFFNMPKDKMLERNLLYIARKVRFWDENETNEIYKLESYKLQNAIKQLSLPDLEKQEIHLSSLTQNGKSYIEAFVDIFGLPNNRFVRKNLSYANVYPLSSIYSLDDEALANTLFPYFLQHRNNIAVICDYYRYLASYYPQKPFTDIVKSNFYRLEDTVALFNLLNKKNLAKFKAEKPRFKDLHDYLSVLVTQQKANEINYHIPTAIIRRLDMQLRNSSCKVLTKYSQVLKAGIDLKNCAASYKKRINDKLQLVLVADENGKAKVLLEINNQAIVQAKLWDNKPVKVNAEYNTVVKEFAEKARLSINTDDIAESITIEQTNIAV